MIQPSSRNKNSYLCILISSWIVSREIKVYTSYLSWQKSDLETQPGY